jgi:hypothetical protein
LLDVVDIQVPAAGNRKLKPVRKRLERKCHSLLSRPLV